MRGIILAAGAGRRLGGIIGPLPKCLVPLGATTLLERQLQELRRHNISPVTVVAGYRHDAVELVCGRDVEIVYNPDYASTNSLYSFWLARNLLTDGFVVLNSDVLFHPLLLTRLLASSSEDARLMAPRQAGTCYSDEEMKVHVRDGRVIEIDKALPDLRTDGENVGIAKFGAEGAAVLVDEVDRLIADGAARAWLPRAFAAFAARRSLHVIETAGQPWIEIDFPEDYARACREILPAIDDTDIYVRRGTRVAASAVTAIFGRMCHRV